MTTFENDTAVQDQRSQAADARDANAYRQMMESVDTSRHVSNSIARERVSQGYTDRMTKALGPGMEGLNKDARDAVMGVRDLVVGRETVVNKTADEVHRILSDSREWPAKRTQDADEKLSEARTKLGDHSAVFDAALSAAQDALLDSARPAIREGEETTARTDARMLLDGAKDVGQARQRVEEYLNSADDSVAGILADSRWLRTYFTGRGWSDHLGYVEPLVRSTVAETARQSLDKARVAAGLNLASLHNYQAAHDAITAMANYLDPRPKKN